MSFDSASASPSIQVRDLGKCYMIYDKPQHRLKQFFWGSSRKFYREFWALQHVSFEVQQGESVGIIGRNGSGKSTLLQMIAGTLTPTTGSVRVQGRVAALLELGSGFNLEFTGRENVFLSGAIMGIAQREVEERFDEIAAFADIGNYIEQPVKTYSSGMFARLAFAVAVCSQPDVLIVDEILAVGDMAFQQKCVARMHEMRENGLTLLFVSHSADSVKSICQKGLFLINGHPSYWGPAEQAVNIYFSHVRDETNREAAKSQSDIGKPLFFQSHVPGRMRYGSGHVQIENVVVKNALGEPQTAYGIGEEIVIEATIKSFISLENLSISFLVRDATGIDLLGTTTFDERVELPALREGERLTVRFRFINCLRVGTFGISLAVNRVKNLDNSDSVLFDQIDGCAAFTVVPTIGRPVHYKFHQPVTIEFGDKDDELPAEQLPLKQTAGSR